MIQFMPRLVKTDRRSHPSESPLIQGSRDHNIRRSRSVSERELPSPVEKAENQAEPNLYPLRGKVLFYEDPFEPAISVEDWEVLR
jgi:hypothetical protein